MAIRIFKEIEEINKKKYQCRYWRYRNKKHLKNFESSRYKKRKEYIIKRNRTQICRSGFKTIKGYIFICSPNHPKANKNGYVAFHRFTMENIIGRILKDSEIVHHVDYNKLNNHPNNLQLFKNINKHSAFHYAGKIKDKNNRFMERVVLDGD